MEASWSTCGLKRKGFVPQSEVRVTKDHPRPKDVGANLCHFLDICLCIAHLQYFPFQVNELGNHVTMIDVPFSPPV